MVDANETDYRNRLSGDRGGGGLNLQYNNRRKNTNGGDGSRRSETIKNMERELKNSTNIAERKISAEDAVSGK